MLNDYKGQDNQIVLPYQFTPRPYQHELFQYVVPDAFAESPVAEGVRRAVLVWHRRAGKDKCSINILTMLAMQEVGNYLYMAPEVAQARKIIWQGIDKQGFRFIDHIPPALIARKTEADMLVQLVNGSTIQLGGADAYDRLMGTNPKGIIFSEYSLMNPQAWNYFRPILAENQGVAIFIYTPRGHNHGYDMYKIAKEKFEDEFNPHWYFSHLTVDDTKDWEGNAVIQQTDIQNEIEEGMPEDMVQQEFYCSFDAGQVGAFYADLIGRLRQQNRVGDYPWIPSSPVYTFWDLGMLDSTAIWWAQEVEGQVRIIDYEEDSGVPLSSWCKIVQDKPYTYARFGHYAPQDINVREYTDGVTRVEVASDLGIEFTVLDKLALQDGINAVRELLPQCVFNEHETEDGLHALANYSKVYDEKAATYRDRPFHNWASHGADAFRVLAHAWPELGEEAQPQRHRVLPAMGRERGYWRNTPNPDKMRRIRQYRRRF